MPRRFNFTGPNGDHETKMGFQVNLGDTESLQCLDQLFEDLFLQWRVDPGYLFVTKEDAVALTRETVANSNVRIVGSPMAGSDIYENGPVGHSVYPRMVTKLINQTTGKLVDLVPLPGLEPNHVIIGFFKQSKEA